LAVLPMLMLVLAVVCMLECSEASMPHDTCLLPLLPCLVLQFMNVLSSTQYADITCAAWPYFVSPMRSKWTGISLNCSLSSRLSFGALD
jgi:hypothetical protein